MNNETQDAQQNRLDHQRKQRYRPRPFRHYEVVLASRLSRTVNRVHPGVVATRLSRAMPQAHRFHLPTVSQARVESADIEGITGTYWVGRAIAEPAPHSTSRADAAKLWEPMHALIVPAQRVSLATD